MVTGGILADSGCIPHGDGLYLIGRREEKRTRDAVFDDQHRLCRVVRDAVLGLDRRAFTRPDSTLKHPYHLHPSSYFHSLPFPAVICSYPLCHQNAPVLCSVQLINCLFRSLASTCLLSHPALLSFCGTVTRPAPRSLTAPHLPRSSGHAFARGERPSGVPRAGQSARRQGTPPPAAPARRRRRRRAGDQAETHAPPPPPHLGPQRER